MITEHEPEQVLKSKNIEKYIMIISITAWIPIFGLLLNLSYSQYTIERVHGWDELPDDVD